MTRKGSLIVISGFSGVGKGTIVEYIRTKYEDYEVSVSCTTRAPRENEVNGREYYFISRDEFLAKREKNGFIESAEYCGNLYGSPRPFIEEKLAEGKRVILEIEIQGAVNIRNQYPDAVLIFIMPPSDEELERRNRRREFYLRNGFDAAPVEYHWQGEHYRLLSAGGTVTDKEFRDFWKEILKDIPGAKYP